MGDEEDGDDPKAMQFAKMDVPEVYMTTNDEELVMKLEQVGAVRLRSIPRKTLHQQERCRHKTPPIRDFSEVLDDEM